jgi:hypothetical protein
LVKRCGPLFFNKARSNSLISTPCRLEHRDA